jgi:hypothetical protein
MLRCFALLRKHVALFAVAVVVLCDLAVGRCRFPLPLTFFPSLPFAVLCDLCGKAVDVAVVEKDSLYLQHVVR